MPLMHASQRPRPAATPARASAGRCLVPMHVALESERSGLMHVGAIGGEALRRGQAASSR